MCARSGSDENVYGQMIRKEDIVAIGKFQKTHALQGELNAIVDVQEDYAEDDKPFIVDVDGIYVPFYIESIRPKVSTSYLVKLAGVDSQEEAQQFVNKEIYAMRSDLIDYFETDGETFVDPDDIEGYEVVDSRLGDLGKVKEVNDATANVLLVVDTPDGDELLVPFVDEFVEEIDQDNKRIVVSLPEGLLEINSKEINSKNDERSNEI